jgi:hypothetical protein
MKNIFETTYGWRVIIMRSGVTFTSNIPFNGDRAAALKKAAAIRDEFYAEHGFNSPHSNTGICGISESVKWAHSKSYPCFAVSVGNRHPRRFVYRTPEERQIAIRQAIALRALLAGENPATLARQHAAMEGQYA